MAMVKLSEVVRSTERIVAGAATFPVLQSICHAGALRGCVRLNREYLEAGCCTLDRKRCSKSIVYTQEAASKYTLLVFPGGGRCRELHKYNNIKCCK